MRQSRKKGFYLCMATSVVWLTIMVWIVGDCVAQERSEPLGVRDAWSVISYRSSGDIPYWELPAAPSRKRRWTPEEILKLLEEYPDYYIDMGKRTNGPTGNSNHREMARVIDEVQLLGKERGIDTSRLMVHFRNDVYAKRRKGWKDCTFCSKTGHCEDLCTWEGTMNGAPFDPSWIITVSRSEHQWAVDNIWAGDSTKDPWSDKSIGVWAKWIDREAISIVNSKSRVAALYGPVKNRGGRIAGRDFAIEVAGVLMDLRNRDYRNWSVKKLIADLRAKGIEPGEGAVIQYVYKPGWHTYYDGENRRDRCFVKESHMWRGPAGPCLWIDPPGGPFTRTPYKPGEFEIAVNAMLREMRAGLVAAGYDGVRIMTVEHPPYEDEYWSILDADIRNAPWIVGNLASTCDRRSLAVPANPMTCRPRSLSGSRTPVKRLIEQDAQR